MARRTVGRSQRWTDDEDAGFDATDWDATLWDQKVKCTRDNKLASKSLFTIYR